MPDLHRLKWTAEQLAQMQQDRAAGLAWDTVALRSGHPENSCRQMMSRIHQNIRDAAARVINKALREQADIKARLIPAPVIVAKKPPEKLRPVIPEAAYGHCTSTARLVAEAEMRARIGVQSITAGLLGDPAPGRSALDKKQDLNR